MSFLNKNEIEDLEKTADEKGTPKEEAAPGIYNATLKKVSVEKSKSSGGLMIVIEQDIGKEYFTIKQWCPFPDKEEDQKIGKEKLITFFKKAFHYSFKPIKSNDLEDALAEVVTQVSGFIGKPYKLAVRHEQDFYTKTVEGEKQVVETMRAKHWYVGHVDEPLDFNEKSAVRYLTPKQKEALLKKAKGQSFIKKETEEKEADWVTGDHPI